MEFVELLEFWRVQPLFALTPALVLSALGIAVTATGIFVSWLRNRRTDREKQVAERKNRCENEVLEFLRAHPRNRFTPEQISENFPEYGPGEIREAVFTLTRENAVVASGNTVGVPGGISSGFRWRNKN